MLLLIPAIDLVNGVSAYPIEGIGEGGPGADPAEIARLLRIENAKSLHVTDLDGARAGRFSAFDAVRSITGRVDIPVEVSGGIGTAGEIGRLLEAGATRIVLRPGFAGRHPEEAAALLAAHGAGRIVASIEHPGPPSADESAPGHPVAEARAAAALGFRRVLYTELGDTAGERVLDAPMLERIARASKLRVTASGGVGSFEALREVAALEAAGVDSVILRRALYENRFSCQAIWRLAEREQYPFTAKV